MIKEEWKMIPGYEGLYMVSNLGRIYSIVKKRLRKLDIHPKGYYTITLIKNKKKLHKGVHFFVALAFIPIPDTLKNISPEELEVHHINGDKVLNIPSNLMWVTRKQHADLHPERYVKISESVKNGKRSKPVCQYTLDGVFVKEWVSINEVKRQLNYANHSITGCCKGEFQTAYGFKWKYKEPSDI